MNNNNRIAFNTGVLYAKLIISSVIGLLCSRFILNALGASDYGLYSVVGGIVTFLNIIGTTMVSVSYRYVAIEIGKGENGDPNKIYNAVLIVHILLILLLFFIGETLGLYYVNNYLNVAEGKLPDAHFVLQVSLITTAISIVSVPANGLIIAKEQFVYTSIVEIVVGIAKLIMVIGLCYFIGNRLRLFSIIMLIITLITSLSYMVYCWYKYKEIVKWKINNNKNDYKSIFVFAGWSLFGAVATVGQNQGSAMIINSFFGTVLNASFGLASQVQRYVQLFSRSLSQAAVPQIMKSYGAGDEDRSLYIVYTISRLSSLILIIVIVPLLLCTEDILKIWLHDVPQYTSLFVIFFIINGYISVLGSGFDPCIQSTGKIKINEICYGVIYLLLLPIMYLLYALGFPPYVNVIVMPLLTLLTRTMQVLILRKLTSFSLLRYIKKSIIPSLSAFALSIIPMLFLRFIWGHSINETIFFVLICALWSCVAVYFLGISKTEKKLIVNIVSSKIKPRNRNRM